MTDIARTTTGYIASEEMLQSQNLEQSDSTQTHLREPGLSQQTTRPRAIRLQSLKGVATSHVGDIAKGITEPVIPAIPPVRSGQISGVEQAVQISGAEQAVKKTKPARIRISFIVRAGVTLLFLLFLFREISWPTLLSLLSHIIYRNLLCRLPVDTLGELLRTFISYIFVRAESLQVPLTPLTTLYVMSSVLTLLLHH